MAFAEIRIDEKTSRNYKDYPRLLEDHGCPRCNSLLITVKIRNFSKDLVRFECTCNECGIYYFAQLVEKDEDKKLVLYEEAEEEDN